MDLIFNRSGLFTVIKGPTTTEITDNAVNQGQATQPGTPSSCSTLTHTIYQTARSIELAAPTQDIVCMGGRSGDGMPSEVSHLRFDVIILDIKTIPQQFLRRDNLQWSILSIPPCIDVTLRSFFSSFGRKSDASTSLSAM